MWKLIEFLVGTVDKRICNTFSSSFQAWNLLQIRRRYFPHFPFCTTAVYVSKISIPRGWFTSSCFSISVWKHGNPRDAHLHTESSSLKSGTPFLHCKPQKAAVEENTVTHLSRVVNVAIMFCFPGLKAPFTSGTTHLQFLPTNESAKNDSRQASVVRRRRQTGLLSNASRQAGPETLLQSCFWGFPCTHRGDNQISLAHACTKSGGKRAAR